MRRSKRKQQPPTKGSFQDDKTIEEKQKSSKGSSSSTAGQITPWLSFGSIVPPAVKKQSWEEECKHLRERNKQLEEKNKTLEEKVEKYKNDQVRLQEILLQHVDRLNQLERSRVVYSSENLQIGNNNTLVNTVDVSDLLDRYEIRIRENERQRKSLEEKIEQMTSTMKDLTDAQKNKEQIMDGSVCMERLQGLHHLGDQKLACPVSSIRMMSEQATELVRNFTPEIIRLQDTIKNLRSYIDEPKLEFLFALCSSQRSLSTVSLDEGQLHRNNNTYQKDQKQRETTSELNISSYH